ncbi:hypothetical protein ALT1644_920002 [Alteromonas macleodii]
MVASSLPKKTLNPCCNFSTVIFTFSDSADMSQSLNDWDNVAHCGTQQDRKRG